jgi:hypothetical protein
MRTWREAYDLSTRLGVAQMTQWLASAIGYGSIFEGLDWETSLDLLDTELERSRSDADRTRLIATRLYIMVWRGENDPELDQTRRRTSEAVSDPDATAWIVIHGALLALTEGRFEEAYAGCLKGLPMSSQTRADAILGLALASHWSRDIDGARVALQKAEEDPWGGRYADGMVKHALAGVAVLEGDLQGALSLFREAALAMTQCGAWFSLAVVQLDALVMLPDEPAIAEWADEARARFEVLKARPLLERLDLAIASRVTA